MFSIAKIHHDGWSSVMLRGPCLNGNTQEMLVAQKELLRNIQAVACDLDLSSLVDSFLILLGSRFLFSLFRLFSFLSYISLLLPAFSVT
jgi:hypothetical protein